VKLLPLTKRGKEVTTSNPVKEGGGKNGGGLPLRPEDCIPGGGGQKVPFLVGEIIPGLGEREKDGEKREEGVHDR